MRFGKILLLVFPVAFSALFFCCDENPANDGVIGQWEIQSWVNSEVNRDLMKDEEAPRYFVDFRTDSVHVLEKESKKTREYTFKYTHSADSLNIETLGDFQIKNLLGSELVLTATGTNIFSQTKELYTHEIKLVRVNK